MRKDREFNCLALMASDHKGIQDVDARITRHGGKQVVGGMVSDLPLGMVSDLPNLSKCEVEEPA